MIDVAVFVLMAVMAFRINRAVSRESATFEQFNQSKSLAPASLLYPVAPLVMFAGMFLLGSIVALLAAAMCFLPGLILGRNRMRAFERTGTDRTDGALAASTQAFGTAMVGLLYVALVGIFAVVGLTR